MGSKRICVVGAGRWGVNHIRTLADLDCLAGVVETSEPTRQKLRDAYPSIELFTDLADALPASFDGYTVATPAETHSEIAGRIIEHGHPVLVEKPMALTTREARRLKRLALERGVLLMVGHLLLFHPAIRKIQELIAAGKIGKLQYLYSNRLNLGTVRTEENILWSFAPHDISVFQYLIRASPNEVVSRGGAFVQPHLHDSTMTVLTYPDNVVGHIFVSWLHPFKEHRLVVIGSKGMLSFDDASSTRELRFYEKGIDWVRGAPIKRDGPTEMVPFEPTPPLTAEMRYYVEHLHDPTVDTAGADSGIEVLDILERASEGLDTCSTMTATPSPDGVGVHPTSIVDDDVEIGGGTRIWHYSHIQSGARIGEHCSIGQNVYVGSSVRIGDHVKIQNNVSVYEGVELEDYVFCGPSMVFTNVTDPRCKYPQRGSESYKKTLVKEGASLGANSTIVCGHSIGRHAFVAAGAVVTKDVPDYALVAGVPAIQKGWVCECGERLPENQEAPVCPRCGLGYGLREGQLTRAE